MSSLVISNDRIGEASPPSPIIRKRRVSSRSQAMNSTLGNSAPRNLLKRRRRYSRQIPARVAATSKIFPFTAAFHAAQYIRHPMFVTSSHSHIKTQLRGHIRSAVCCLRATETAASHRRQLTCTGRTASPARHRAQTFWTAAQPHRRSLRASFLPLSDRRHRPRATTLAGAIPPVAARLQRIPHIKMCPDRADKPCRLLCPFIEFPQHRPPTGKPVTQQPDCRVNIGAGAMRTGRLKQSGLHQQPPERPSFKSMPAPVYAGIRKSPRFEGDPGKAPLYEPPIESCIKVRRLCHRTPCRPRPRFSSQ